MTIDTSDEITQEEEILASICANRVAQWLVQGDYCFIAIRGESTLWLQSLTDDLVIEFEQWNGCVNVHHGLCWSTLELTSACGERTWWVHGLPRQKARPFAALLTSYYVAWTKDRVAAFDHALPEIEKTIQQYQAYPFFMRETEYQAMRDTVVSCVALSELPQELLRSFRPRSMAFIDNWLQEELLQRNERWCVQELARWETWLDAIEALPLNHSQRNAVVVNQDHNLILAGAGSGKTSVLVARANYLLTSKTMDANEILMLAFGNQAAKEMAERLAVGALNQIKVSTFHSIAMRLIESATQTKPEVAPFSTDQEARKVFFDTFMAQHYSDPTIVDKWNKHLELWPIPGLQRNGHWLDGIEARTVDWLWSRLGLLQQATLNKAQWKNKIIESSVGGEHQKQAISELNLLWPLLSKYYAYLKEHSQVDFNTMIHHATTLVSKGKATVPWRTIMVDEYQDISPHRLALLEALTHTENAPSLYAVGDDWQAIYRFAGADVSLTTGFETRYPHGHIGVLDTTYRFSNMLGDVANQFVQQNRDQLTKPLNAHRQQRKKAVCLLNQGLLEQELSALAQRQAEKEVSVLLLGRTHKQMPVALDEWQTKWPNLSLRYSTCHASKGQQADYVFILNVERGVFPMKSRDSGLMRALQVEHSDIAYAEERRLFYVALTRAKHQVWVCANPESQSVFVDELATDKYPVVNKLKRKKK
ncbi:DNA helicase IV [Thaumasiovibrio sp. DFM-14]|uniref:DNA helicase IV n=1 Tax=Thaumasiovibrio sp. DFM-14 TaxID=3384792 RepID=UPI0039A0E060